MTKGLTEQQRKEFISYGYFDTKLRIKNIFGLEYTRDEKITPREINGKLELVAESIKRDGQPFILKNEAQRIEAEEILKEQKADRKILLDYWEIKERRSV
jgi:hypothetical protein